jgi:hypothetical protein
MMGFLKKIILLGFCAGGIFFARAQVKFTASISPAQISKNEYAVLRLEVENGNNIENISPPSLKGFIVVSGPNQESGMSNVNGVVKQYVALSYILQPQQTGNISLDPATAKISGKLFKSNPLNIVVKKGTGTTPPANNVSANPPGFFDPFTAPRPTEEFDDYILKKGESVQQKVDRNMQLKLQTSKTSCYVGEPIVATYKLYTRLKSESKLSKTPSFNGFSVIDLQRPDETEYAREKLNNREYNVYTIRKAQLYPLQDGSIELESATLDNNIQFLKADASADPQQNMNGFLDGFSINPDAVITESVSLSNKPITITVKPLPEAGKPTGFKGAVGKFSIRAALERNNFSTNETGKLTLTISGSGNLQHVTAPDIDWPDGIEPFEPKEQEDLQLLNVPVSGSKIFEFPFAVDSPGNYHVPAIDFSYFDPALASYKTIHIVAQNFTVTKGLDKPTYLAGDIGTQQSTAGFTKTLAGNRGLIFISIALMMLAGIFMWLRNDRKISRKKDRAVPEIVPPEQTAEEPSHYKEIVSFNQQNPLSKSEDCLKNTNCIQFYTLLYGEMKEWLAYRFSLEKAAVNVKTITSAMDKAGIDNEVVLQLQQLLQEIEWQLYTPFERNETMGLIYSRSQAILQMINNYEAVTL